ncbi:MAG: nucleotidyltransferase [Candidatus Omnitrophota bacterium]
MTWEEAFSSWAQAPAKTEQERCANAEKAVRNAISASSKLKYKDIKIFTQGSYRNNTNVKKESDVDIGILCRDTFFFDLPEGSTRGQFGINTATYSYEDFKNDVQNTLVSYFGASAVKRGNKAFDIHENSYHVDSDVAPFFEHRRYNVNGQHSSGVELRPDNGGRVINWPEQHYDNGVSKNTATSRRFKSLVRIVKSLCNYMSDQGVAIAGSTPSFLLECLVWNVSNDNFGHYSYSDDVRACLTFLYNNTSSDDKCNDWGEVSELKYLFRGGQKWTREQAHNFISSAWNYIGFK